MKYQIQGDSDCPLVHIQLNRDEIVKIERGSMAYLSNVELSGKMNSKKKGVGGLISAMGRSLTSGESLFMTHAKGLSDDACIGVAPSTPGKIQCLKVDQAHQYCLNTGAFLCCDDSVSYVMKKQSVGKALLGGTGGFFIMKTEGHGDVMVNAFGDLLVLDVALDCPLTIDNEHVVAWDSTLEYVIRIASGTFGFTTGEGLVNEFHGKGKVLIQTRNLHNLAQAIQPFIQTSSN